MKKIILFCFVILIEILSSCKGEGERKIDILWSTEIGSISDLTNSNIKEAIITDVNNDGINEVIVALNKPKGIYIIDGASGEIIKTINYTTEDYLTVGDINNDEQKEIILIPLKVLSPSGKVLWSKNEFQWDETIENYDGTQSTITFTLVPQKSTLIDIDNDGKLDIVVIAQSKWGLNSFVCGISGSDGKLFWCTPTNDINGDWVGAEFVQHPIVGHINNSPIVISTGCTYVGLKCATFGESFECKMFAIDGGTGEILWITPTVGCNTNIYGLLDVNKDGRTEIVSSHDVYNEVQCMDNDGAISTSKIKYSILDVYALNGELLYSHTLPRAIETITGFFNSKKLDGVMAFGEIEGEMVGIVTIAHDNQENGLIKCNGGGVTLDTVRLVDGVVIASYPNHGEPVTGDLDGDGIIESAFLMMDKFIQVYNPEDGSPLWWYDIGELDRFGFSHGGSFKSKPVIGDVDGDGFLEIVAIGDKDVNPDENVYEYKRCVYALKTGAPVPSSRDLLPWPMSYHDPYCTGNYNFVP